MPRSVQARVGDTAAIQFGKQRDEPALVFVIDGKRVILVEQRILQGRRLLGPLPAGEEPPLALLPDFGVGAWDAKKASVVTHCLLDAIETVGFPEVSV